MRTMQSHGRLLRRRVAGSGPDNRKMSLAACAGRRGGRVATPGCGVLPFSASGGLRVADLEGHSEEHLYALLFFTKLRIIQSFHKLFQILCGSKCKNGGGRGESG